MNQKANATVAASNMNCDSSGMSTLQTVSKNEKPSGVPTEESCEDTVRSMLSDFMNRINNYRRASLPSQKIQP